MLYYPKIPDTKGCPGGRCIAFEKVDGTNIHLDWDRDHGFHAFGTRRDVFAHGARGNAAFLDAHPGLEGTFEAFQALAEPLDRILRTTWTAQEVRVFAELVGDGSFAGAHVAGTARRLVLFDVELMGHGLVPPETFIAELGALPIPRVVYRGKLSGQLVEDVRKGLYGVDEGVVIKGVGGAPWMAKVKTNAYLERLKSVLGARWVDHWE
jgi:hypothetical protein